MAWTLGFVGCGVMAEVMIAGLLDEGLLSPENVVASNRRPERGEELKSQYGIRTTTDRYECRNPSCIERERACTSCATNVGIGQGADPRPPTRAGGRTGRTAPTFPGSRTDTCPPIPALRPHRCPVVGRRQMLPKPPAAWDHMHEMRWGHSVTFLRRGHMSQTGPWGRGVAWCSER